MIVDQTVFLARGNPAHDTTSSDILATTAPPLDYRHPVAPYLTHGQPSDIGVALHSGLRVSLISAFSVGPMSLRAVGDDELEAIMQSIITGPNQCAQRKLISTALRSIDEHHRARVIRRLQSKKHFLATYNELAALVLLLPSRLSVEYEPRFVLDRREFTPDLALRDRNGGLVALVEVSTRFRTNQLRSDERRWEELQSRIRKIPRPLVLMVGGTGLKLQAEAHIEPPDSGGAKRIASAIRTWLFDTSLSLGARYTVDAYTFRVIAEGVGSYADLATPTDGMCATTDLALAAINDKVHRYAELSEHLGASLIVVLAAEPGMPLDYELVQTAIDGTQGMRFALNLFSSGSVSGGSMQLRNHNGPAQFHRALSLVGWLEPGIDHAGRLRLLPVASASCNLRESLGPQLMPE